MAEVMITAEKREDHGKSESRRLRREGRVPGILYGADKEPIQLSFDKLELGRLLRHEYTIVKLTLGKKEQQAVIKEIQVHPVTEEFVHVDFMRVSAGHEIRVTVPIHVVGKPKGIQEGGIFTHIKNEIYIAVLPRFMPENIEIDVSEMELGDALRVKDLKVENMTILDEQEEVICRVAIPRPEEEEEPEELEDEEDMEPEVITARKDDEESEESEDE